MGVMASEMLATALVLGARGDVIFDTFALSATISPLTSEIVALAGSLVGWPTHKRVARPLTRLPFNPASFPDDRN